MATGWNEVLWLLQQGVLPKKSKLKAKKQIRVHQSILVSHETQKYTDIFWYHRLLYTVACTKCWNLYVVGKTVNPYVTL